MAREMRRIFGRRAIMIEGLGTWDLGIRLCDFDLKVRHETGLSAWHMEDWVIVRGTVTDSRN